MSALRVEVLTIEGTVLARDAVAVSLPTVLGEISILKDHEPLVSVLRAGVIRVRDQQRSEVVVCAGGFVEVHKNCVVILAYDAQPAAAINREAAQNDLVHARQILAKAGHSALARSDAQRLADYAQARLAYQESR